MGQNLKYFLLLEWAPIGHLIARLVVLESGLKSISAGLGVGLGLGL